MARKNQTTPATGAAPPANSDSPAVGGHASAAVGAPLVAARAAVVEKIKPWKEITNPNHK